MAENKPNSSTRIVENCIFCLIANDQDKETEVIIKVCHTVKEEVPLDYFLFYTQLLQNNELVCFRDIVPAAPHHYLVVPIQHIDSCFSMNMEHIGLVERMAEMGKAVLHDQGITDMKDISLGFHQPPFTSVDHLHLHVLAPKSQIYSYLYYKFVPSTHRFITEERLRRCLKDKAPSVYDDLCLPC